MQVGQRSVRVTIRDCHGLFAFGWVELLMGGSDGSTSQKMLLDNSATFSVLPVSM